MSRVAKPVPMPARWVDMHPGRQLGLLQRVEVKQAAVDMVAIVLRLDEERGKCIAIDLQLG